jgi:hypothetical protein
MKNVLFEENQKNVILIIVPALVAVIVGMFAIVQISTGKPIGNHPISNHSAVIAFFITVIIGFLLGSQKLKITITQEEILYSFGIFSSRSVIKISDVQSMSIIKYDALTEFWGWGVRYNSTTDCYTVSGDTGLEIILAGKKKRLLGTQKQVELQQILQTCFSDKIKATNQN